MPPNPPSPEPTAPEPAAPDYPLADSLPLTDPAQFKAFGHPLRGRIVTLLIERAATVTQLAAALGAVKGTVLHHVRVLEAAGLIAVVRTAKVRGAVERYYGRTARSYEMFPGGGPTILRAAIAEMAEPGPDDHDLVHLRHVRLTSEQVKAFSERMLALAEELAPTGVVGPPDAPIHGLLLSVYRTNHPDLPADPPSTSG